MSEDAKVEAPEVIDWSQLFEQQIPYEELPSWTKAIILGNEQRVRDIVRSARAIDEDLKRDEFSRDEILLLDWKIEQLKSKLAIMSSKIKNSCPKQKCKKCQR